MTDQSTIRKVTVASEANRINDIAKVLEAVETLEYEDKNCLCNSKALCQIKQEYLREIRYRSAAILEMAR